MSENTSEDHSIYLVVDDIHHLQLHFVSKWKHNTAMNLAQVEAVHEKCYVDLIWIYLEFRENPLPLQKLL